MKYVVKFEDDTYWPITTALNEATRFNTRMEAMTFLTSKPTHCETARIVRLRPKAKPSVIPEPRVTVGSCGSGWIVFINGREVGAYYSHLAACEISRDSIKKALGLSLTESP